MQRPRSHGGVSWKETSPPLSGGEAQPDFAAGIRVQQLIDAAPSSHRERATVNIAPEQSAHEREV
jgi:hypothetical protein